jgi:hypothetical protein
MSVRMFHILNFSVDFVRVLCISVVCSKKGWDEFYLGSYLSTVSPTQVCLNFRRHKGMQSSLLLPAIKVIVSGIKAF